MLPSITRVASKYSNSAFVYMTN